MITISVFPLNFQNNEKKMGEGGEGGDRNSSPILNVLSPRFPVHSVFAE